MREGRRILGNLLCEDELRPRRTHPSRSALETASALATLLRVFAREGDRLWTLAPVDPERVLDVPGLPRTLLESGRLRDLPPVTEVLAWGETPEAAVHRLGQRTTSLPLDAPLHELLWGLSTSDPATVAEVHSRFFCLRVAEDLGLVLPGSRIVASLSDLERILGSREAPRSWVVKSPLSAAGRDRHIQRNGPGLAGPKARRTVERLFERWGPLLFEPWMDRTADFGVSALLAPSGLRIVGIHGQRVDARGQFAGIDLAPVLSGEDRDRLLETTEAVAASLRRAGYGGPFGIDAWRYRTEDGAEILHPLGEINARMTFGLVAWTCAERLQGLVGRGDGVSRLLFGSELPEKGVGIVPLLSPGAGNGPAAWIEI